MIAEKARAGCAEALATRVDLTPPAFSRLFSTITVQTFDSVVLG